MELKDKAETKKKKRKKNNYIEELLFKYGRGGLLESPAPQPVYIDKKV